MEEEWNNLYQDTERHYDKLWKFRYYFRGLKKIKE